MVGVIWPKLVGAVAVLVTKEAGLAQEPIVPAVKIPPMTGEAGAPTEFRVAAESSDTAQELTVPEGTNCSR